MIPFLCVFLFSILGTWIMIDPLGGEIILNFPEFVGRLAFVVWYRIVSLQPVIVFHIKLMPIRSIIFYADLIDEALLMSITPLGGEPEDDE